MDKRVSRVPPVRDAENSPVDRGVVDLADARVKIRSRVRPTAESLTQENIHAAIRKYFPPERHTIVTLLPEAQTAKPAAR